MSGSFLHRAGRAPHCPDDAQMGTATAQIIGQYLFDLGFVRVLVPGEEGRRLHDHAVDAVTALRSLLVDKGFLDWMRLVGRSQAFEGYNLSYADRRERHHAGAHRLAVNVYGARPALS